MKTAKQEYIIPYSDERCSVYRINEEAPFEMITGNFDGSTIYELHGVSTNPDYFELERFGEKLLNEGQSSSYIIASCRNKKQVFAINEHVLDQLKMAVFFKAIIKP